MGDDTAAMSQNFIPPVLRPPMHPTHTVVKNSSSGYFGVSGHQPHAKAAKAETLSTRFSLCDRPSNLWEA